MSGRNEQQETEANLFAMCLLMPDNLVRKEVRAMGNQLDLFDDDQIKGLAKKFGVSVPLMMIRLTQIYPGIGSKLRSMGQVTGNR